MLKAKAGIKPVLLELGERGDDRPPGCGPFLGSGARGYGRLRPCWAGVHQGAAPPGRRRSPTNGYRPSSIGWTTCGWEIRAIRKRSSDRSSTTRRRTASKHGSGGSRAGRGAPDGRPPRRPLHPTHGPDSVRPDLKVWHEEVFGPVVVVERYRDFEDAVARIDDSHYGIHAGIFTHDIRRIDHAFRNLTVGGVIVNDYPPVWTTSRTAA